MEELETSHRKSMSSKLHILAFLLLAAVAFRFGEFLETGWEKNGLLPDLIGEYSHIPGALDDLTLSEPDSDSITINQTELLSEQNGRKARVTSEEATIPKEFWNRKIVQPLSEDIRLSDDARALFGLNEEKSAAINGVLESLITGVREVDFNSYESRIIEGSVLVKIPGSQENPEKELENLAQRLSQHFRSLTEARFFVEQSKEDLAIKTGIFGASPRIIKIEKNPNNEGFIAVINSGGAVGELGIDEYEKMFQERIPVSGAKSTIIPFTELPPFLNHLFDQQQQKATEASPIR